ncbi:MAG: glycoside hydrolase family 19 protein [Blastocatellales bacterium]
MQLSESQLRQIMPKLQAGSASMYLPFLNRVMQIYRIDSPLRASAFLAQLAHESGELRYWEEIWGPTPQQMRYEPPSDLAARLGNTQPGDGYRFRGRGPIQITGRFNYRKYGNLLGVDIESNPDLASTTQIGFSIAGIYWQNNGLNELADAQDFVAITRKINGGLNGLESRLKYYERAKVVLGVGGSRGVTTRSASLIETATIISYSSQPLTNSLPRGYEEIERDMASVKTTTKPAKKAAVKPAKKAAAKPAKKAAVKSAKKVAVTSAKKAAAKPAKKTAAKPAKKTAVKPAKKTAVKPAKKAAVKPAKKTAVKPSKKVAVKPAKKAAAKPAKKAAVKSANKVAAKGSKKRR